MKSSHRVGRRGAFTLIELIVVIAIITVIAVIGALLFPRLQDSQKIVRAADRLQGVMLNAKQRAKRDSKPTGVRILLDPKTNQATQLQYVQQPDYYTTGQCLGTGPTPAALVTFANVDFQGPALTLGQPDQATVQAGDYLEVFGGGGVYQITAVVSQTSLNINPPAVISPAAYYRIIRQPRRLAGEETLDLPNEVVIDGAYSLNLPQRQVGTAVFYEIVFAPGGGVIGQGTGADKICLWLRDPALADPTDGDPLLVAIQTRTGFVGVYPVGPPSPGDPYQATREGRSSGY
jgi:prepilin-type N-terminal cleavage/methylation domain-containing protein